MFVFSSTYERETSRLASLALEHKRRAEHFRQEAENWQYTARHWKDRYDRLQADLLGLGGGQFTKAEIRTLIQLCHPDKHDGKQSAVEITQKLIKLRGPK